MKTVKKDEKIKRVSNDWAAEMVKSGWSYCPKSEWKEKVRDIESSQKSAAKDDSTKK